MVQDGVALTERMSSGLRRAMVDNQVRTFDVTDQRVLEVFYRVPRERFLPPALAPLAYSDAQVALPAGPGKEGRVLLPPMFLAKLIQNAPILPESRILVVASATGYAAAIVAELCASVVALDSEPSYSNVATVQLMSLGITNVSVVTGPLAAGYAAGAPYDIILVNGAVECKLEGLFKQLAPRGSLLTIEAKSGMATRRAAKAMRFDMIDGEVSARALFDATVPVLPEFRETPGFVF